VDKKHSRRKFRVIRVAGFVYKRLVVKRQLLHTRSPIFSKNYRYFLPPVVKISGLTRKLCYRKDDRAMRSIYECPGNLRDSLTTSTATFPKILWAFVPMVPSERSLVSSYKPSINIIPL